MSILTKFVDTVPGWTRGGYSGKHTDDKSSALAVVLSNPSRWVVISSNGTYTTKAERSRWNQCIQRHLKRSGVTVAVRDGEVYATMQAK